MENLTSVNYSASGDFQSLEPFRGTPEYGKKLDAIKRREYARGFKAGTVEKGSAETEEAFPELKEQQEEVKRSAYLKMLKVESVMDIAETPPDPEQTLLGNRWLCRGGAALMVAPSGVGKSSASMQMDLCWAVGKEAFGIKPGRPLRILIIQAENDPGDMHEMVRGTMQGMGFSKQEEAMIRENVYVVFEQSRTGEAFVTQVVEPLLEAYKPDLLRIDPLSAYAGADMTQADKSADLLRNKINPLLSKYGCGLFLVHHTPKVNGRKTDDWKPSDWMYAGAGSADIVNWARAMIVIDPTQEVGTFRFITAKRAARIGWEGVGEARYIKWLRHSTNGGMFWEETEAAPEALKKSKPKRTPEEVFQLIPLPPGRIGKEALIIAANDNGTGNGIGKNLAKDFLNILIAEGRVEVVEEKRSRTNHAKYIRRVGEECTFATRIG